MKLADRISSTPPAAPSTGRSFASGQLGDIALRYLQSDDFLKLSNNYRNVRRRDIDRLLRHRDGRVACVPVDLLKPALVERHLDEFKNNPARERLKTLRALSKTAKRLGCINTDFCLGVSRAQAPTAGYRPWDLQDVAMFRAFWPYGTEQRAAFEVLYWCGCRISDALRIGPEDVTPDGWLSFAQQKTGGPVHIPFRRALPGFAVPEDLEHLMAAIRAMGIRNGPFVQKRGGRERSAKAAAAWFSAAARKAGLPAGRTSHGLRKSRMILHAERGATSEQIAAWSGHEDLRIVHYYVREANKRHLLSPREEVLASPAILDQLHAILARALSD